MYVVAEFFRKTGKPLQIYFWFRHILLWFEFRIAEMLLSAVN